MTTVGACAHVTAGVVSISKGVLKVESSRTNAWEQFERGYNEIRRFLEMKGEETLVQTNESMERIRSTKTALNGDCST